MDNVFVGEIPEHKNMASGEEGRNYFKRRVFRRRSNEDDRARLNIRQKCILLSLVKSVYLINKDDGFFIVALANIPPFVKWAASAFGVKSDLDYGFGVLIKNYESQKNITGFNTEAALYVILVSKINKTPEMVYDFTHSLDSNVSKAFIQKYFNYDVLTSLY